MITTTSLTKIGIFYDGNFFFHVSNHYLYDHPRRSRISINGIHQFIVHEVARQEERPVKQCKIVDMHYFRGRVAAYEAQARDLLLKERIFDDILMKEGVIIICPCRRKAKKASMSGWPWKPSNLLFSRNTT